MADGKSYPTLDESHELQENATMSVSRIRSTLLTSVDAPGRLSDEKLLNMMADAEEYARNELGRSAANGHAKNGSSTDGNSKGPRRRRGA